MSNQRWTRSFFVDLLKLLAAQLIVIHHFSAYGSLPPVLEAKWPTLMEQIFNNSRLAVQIFLVVGGFLAAQSLSTQRSLQPLQNIKQRYARLMPSYVLALFWVSAIAWALRPMITGNWLTPSPDMRNVLAHLSLMQSILNIPALTTGVWYVAIDFQLYALLVLIFSVTHRLTLRSGMIASLTVASIWIFNRQSNLDNWAIYFFGSYGLGVLAAWAKRSEHDAYIFMFVLFFGIAAWSEDHRIRLAIAMVCAMTLFLFSHRQIAEGALTRWVQTMSDSSYAIFLTHFGVLIILNAIWEQWHLQSATHAVMFTAVGCLLSNLVGWAFHRWGEKPIIKRLIQKPQRRPAAAA
jgi:peptidoglycan/LPS O-acetylase OafA/YrhL